MTFADGGSEDGDEDEAAAEEELVKKAKKLSGEGSEEDGSMESDGFREFWVMVLAGRRVR